MGPQLIAELRGIFNIAVYINVVAQILVMILQFLRHAQKKTFALQQCCPAETSLTKRTLSSNWDVMTWLVAQKVIGQAHHMACQPTHLICASQAGFLRLLHFLHTKVALGSPRHRWRRYCIIRSPTL